MPACPCGPDHSFLNPFTDNPNLEYLSKKAADELYEKIVQHPASCEIQLRDLQGCDFSSNCSPNSGVGFQLGFLRAFDLMF